MTILNTEKPPLEDILSHHGVKGMKWGVRRGGLGTRIRGAVNDSNQRRITTARAVATGTSKPRDRFRSTFFTFTGFTQSRKLAQRRVSVLEARDARIKAGHVKVGDILSQVGHVLPQDLVVSRLDKRGA